MPAERAGGKKEGRATSVNRWMMEEVPAVAVVEAVRYVWTAMGIQGLKSNGMFEKYGQPHVASRVAAELVAECIWNVMVFEEWVLLEKDVPAASSLHKQRTCTQRRAVHPRAARRVAQETELPVTDRMPPDSPDALSVVLDDWMRSNPGCVVEVSQQPDMALSEGLSENSLVQGLLRELTAFDLDPWGPEGVNETLAEMRDRKTLFGVSAPSLREDGVEFLSPQVCSLRDAATAAGNGRLASFISQATLDPNVFRIFSKFFPPGSLINSSLWHQDQGDKDQQTWSRCLIYLTSGSEHDAQPLHYIAFRAKKALGIHVRVGFPRSLAMSGRLRCGTVSVGNRKVRFEHKGEPPMGTACCFALDVESLNCFLEDYEEYIQELHLRPAQIHIPAELCTSHYYRVVEDEVQFMDPASHAAWLEESGLAEYWVRGGQVLKHERPDCDSESD